MTAHRLALFPLSPPAPGDTPAAEVELDDAHPRPVRLRSSGDRSRSLGKAVMLPDGNTGTVWALGPRPHTWWVICPEVDVHPFLCVVEGLRSKGAFARRLARQADAA